MSDEDVTKMDASIIDVTGKSEYAESKESEPIDKVDWFIMIALAEMVIKKRQKIRSGVGAERGFVCSIFSMDKYMHNFEKSKIAIA